MLFLERMLGRLNVILHVMQICVISFLFRRVCLAIFQKKKRLTQIVYSPKLIVSCVVYAYAMYGVRGTALRTSTCKGPIHQKGYIPYCSKNAWESNVADDLNHMFKVSSIRSSQFSRSSSSNLVRIDTN